MNAVEVLIGIIEHKPYDIAEIAAVLSNNVFSKEELMRAAIKAAEKYEFSEMLSEYRKKIEEDEYGDWYIRRYTEYDPIIVEEIRVHPLIKTLELLLENGLDPRVRMAEDPTNIMCVLEDVDTPFLAATAMRLMMIYGADPYVQDESGEGLFERLDSCMVIDISLLPEDIVQNWFQCWILLIGFGARPENVEPFHLQPGHTYDELKEFEYYEWKIRRNPGKKNTMHIFDIRTGKEIGWL
jgi:hypothetical protein